MSRNSWFGFVAYGVLAGSTWLLDGFATGWPSLLRLAVHDGVVCGLFVLVAVLRKTPWPRVGWERVAGWGALLLAGPAVLFAGAGSSVSPLSGALVFALVPAVTVFLAAQREQEAMRLLLPALAGVGGLALMVPFALPPTWFGEVWLGLLVVCAGAVAVAGIRLHEQLAGFPLVWVCAIATGAAAILAGVGWAGFQPGTVAWSGHTVVTEVGWGVVVDAPLTLLLMWLLRAMPPAGLAARFTALPLVTILGGLLMLRPAIGWTTGLGIALALGSVWILVTGSSETVGASPGVDPG